MRKEMFNPFRLFRRRDRIDDTTTAYIEGRMTAAERAEIKSRLANEPDLRKELDSLKATVSLLRSAEPVRAPRSFALSEAPVRARRRRTTPRFAMAPAVLAIAAAAGVGLLAVGNLADVVDQSGTSDGASRNVSIEQTVDSDTMSMTMEPGQGGENGALPDSAVTALSSATPEAIGTTIVPDEAFAPAPTPSISESQRTEQAPGMGGDSGASDTEGASAPPPGTAGITSSDLGDASASPSADGNPERSSVPVATAPVDDDSWLSLPVWQLQAALAALAVAMVGLWALMRHRASE